MTRDVLFRKLDRLRTYIADLEPHAGKSATEVEEDAYEIERLLELIVQVSVDLVTHDLAERSVVPETYRDAFRRAGDEGLLPTDLAASLADAAGLRNILVHIYEQIDYEIVAASIERAIVDAARLIEVYQSRLDSEA